MAQNEYFPSGQFTQLLEQREHDDKFFTEVVLATSKIDMDIGEFMVNDIVNGNTHTMRKFWKKSQNTSFQAHIYNGTLYDDRTTHNELFNMELYSMVPLKDDYSTSMGAPSYAKLPDTDIRRQNVKKCLKSLNMDWEKVSQDVLYPDPISGGPDDPSFKEYKTRYKNSPSLQEEYPSIQDYYNQVVQDQQQQYEEIDSVTDVYTGIAGTGATLGEVNVTAIYYTYIKILPQLLFTSYNPPSSNVVDWTPYPRLSYAFEYRASSFTAVCGMTEWSWIIRSGVVRDEFDPPGSPPEWRKGKCNHSFFYGKTDARKNHVDGDPIVQIIRPNPQDGRFGSGSTVQNIFTGLVQFHVQLTSDTYGEIRMWDYGTMHAITANDGHVTTLTATVEATANNSDPDAILPDQECTVPDGSTYICKIDAGNYNGPYFEIDDSGDGAGFKIDPSTGDLESVAPLDYKVANVYYIKIHIIDDEGYEDNIYVTIHVENTNNEPEPPPRENPYEDEQDDIEHKGSEFLFFPIDASRETKRHIPFFKRERFLRESTILTVYAIEVVELKWYQRGWFKIALMIILAIIMIVVTEGWGALTFQNVITTVFELVIANLVIMAISNLADSSWIALVLVIAISLYVGNFDFSFDSLNLADIAVKGMDAADLIVKKHYADEMEKLKNEMEEFQEKISEMKKEIDKAWEEAGGRVRSDAGDFLKFLASLTTPETGENFFARTLNIDNAIIDDVDNMDDIENMFPKLLR